MEKHSKVTPRQAELVATLVHEGCTITVAAERIGANRSWASTALKKQHVQDYMLELARSVLGTHSVRALATMGDLLDAKSGYLRFEAARDLMDRAGLSRESEAPSAPPVNIQINLG